MIHLDGLSGEEHGRLHELIHGRSDFAAFARRENGRRITIWLMSDDALARIEKRMEVAETPAAPEPTGPPARKPVPIRTGARSAEPGSPRPN